MKELLGMNLTEILKSAVRESVEGVIGDEKLRQKKVVDALRGFKAPAKKAKSSPEQDDVDEAEDANADQSQDGLKDPVSPKKSDLPEITLPLIIDLIGNIRAGKSLKEKETQVALKGYYDRLNGNERVALYAFLSGISKVMANIEGPASEEKTNVPTPDKAPYKIQMKKDAPKQDDSKPRGEEDEDNPIIVGESANKQRELTRLRNLK